MMARLTAGFFLVVVWLFLWGDVSVANVLSGIAVVVLLFLVFPPAVSGSRIRVHPGAALYLLAWFLWQLVISNVLLVRLVFSPGRRIHRGVLEVPLLGASESLMRFVAGLVALTPGTVMVELRSGPSTIFVHVMLPFDIERARRDTLRMNELVVHAFGTLDEIARLEAGSK